MYLWWNLDIIYLVAALGVDAALRQSGLGSFAEFRFPTPWLIGAICEKTSIRSLSDLLLKKLRVGSIPGDIIGSENNFNYIHR